jgi:glycosyltransferase involved in cell wall biosynthesis
MREFEVVIVDDGSTDRTPEIIDSLACRDARVRAIRVPHGGIIQSLNAGIAACEADLVARMDADDISHPCRLEAQVALMGTRPDISVCSCLVRMFPRHQLLGGLVKYEHWLNSLVSHEQISKDIFVESPVAHPSIMIRRDDLVRVGGYQERGWPEDYDLWLRCHASGMRFHKVDSALLWWRQSGGRLTFTDSRYSLENFLRAKAHYLAKRLEGSGRPLVIWGAGMTGRRISKHLEREGLTIEAFVDIDQKKIGRTLRTRPILGPEALEQRRDAFVISAVGSRVARNLIRQELARLGFIEEKDFICAA